MLRSLIKFFKDYRKTDKPVLLAFSGGPDSLALLQLLREYRQQPPLSFALAHVNHGWRTESGMEASQIAAMAEELGKTLHLKTLDPKLMKGNLEAVCREERLRFFASLCQEHDYEAVMLAHHSDDQAETVLKRTLEGVTLPYLSSLSPETELYGVKVWRPLLTVSKAQIIHWLDQRGLKGFSDVTNFDPKFLRARLRMQILPALSEMFGKEVSSGLCTIAKEAGELRRYLDAQVAVYLSTVVKEPSGYFLDLSQQRPSSFFELKYLLRQFCKMGDFVLRRDYVEQAAKLIEQKAAKKIFKTGSGENSRCLSVDHGCLFLSFP